MELKRPILVLDYTGPEPVHKLIVGKGLEKRVVKLERPRPVDAPYGSLTGTPLPW